MKTGHIRFGIDRKVYFEYYELPEPPTDKKMANFSYGYTIAMKKYEASKQLIEVSNKYDPFKVNKSIYWILLSNKDLPVNWHVVTDNNQPCKAEVTGDKATIVELIK